MENNGLYGGLTATLIGGVGRADYETPLRKLGFAEIFRAHDKDKKSLKKMGGLISRSDITIILMGCCSHNQRKKAKTICDKVDVPLISIGNSYGPQSVMNYLVENYSRIKPRVNK